jgi:predicted transcriptional regulator
MNKSIFFITSLFLLFSFSSIIPVSADIGGYTVEPAGAGIVASPPAELGHAGFWNLPPRVMAIYLALVLSPLLVFPVELLFLLKLLALLGYRQIAKKNVLESPSRNAVYQFIRKTPGSDFMEISRKTGVPENSLRYHLAILKLMNKVTALDTSRNARYFENSGSYSEVEQVVLKYLHNKPTRILLQLVLENPDLTRKQIENIIGISGAGVNWHMHRLSDDGLLIIGKNGRNARYTVNSDIVPYLKKYLPLYKDAGMQTKT